MTLYQSCVPVTHNGTDTQVFRIHMVTPPQIHITTQYNLNPFILTVTWAEFLFFAASDSEPLILFS
jgi:hypothetical protein